MVGRSDHWSTRLHGACATVAWCCALNAAWLGLTLLGGVLLGLGPATVTASVLSRRRIRGEAVRAVDFWRTWRREFWPGNAVVLPIALALGLLLTNEAYLAGAAKLVTLAALVLVAGLGAYLPAMYAHYAMPLAAYPVKALRFALARPVPTVLLLFVAAALGFASVAEPLLPLVVSIGAWLHASTWLSLRFFQENEDRRAAGPRVEPVRVLPREPVRIR